MKIELRNVAELRPYKNNPHWNDGAVEAAWSPTGRTGGCVILVIIVIGRGFLGRVASFGARPRHEPFPHRHAGPGWQHHFASRSVNVQRL